jgi:predicted negative regulator of RcsB-dependent stress response
MAAYDLEEQEQLANLKAWWNQNGNLITGALLAVSVAVAGWQGWGWYQRNQSAQASALYAIVQAAAAAGDGQRAKTAAGDLIDKFGGTQYAPLGAMIAGKLAFDSGDLKTARAQLSWAADHGGDELHDLAALRLASVLLDDKAPDEALKLLASPKLPAFTARFAETRGDILLAQDKTGAAIAEYDAALKLLSEPDAASRNARARDLVQQKRDALGAGK